VDATTTRGAGSDGLTYAAAVFAPLRDAWLAGRARLTMLAAVGSAAAEVAVESYRGRMVLAGDVASDETRTRIEASVRELAGVCGVSNQIRIRGTQYLRPGGSDAEIRTALTAQLRQAPELRPSIITVDTVYDGVVRLMGVAHDGDASARAFDLAIDTPGVRRVINDIALQTDTAADDDAYAA
jgi:osmotically-inducible protein OsmY